MPIRILPILIGLAAFALLAKVGGLWVDLDRMADGDDARGGETAAYAAVVALPPSPEAILNPANGLVLGAEPLGSGQPANAVGVEDNAPAAGDPDPEDGDPEGADEGAASAEPEPVHDPFDISDEELALLQRLVKRREALEGRARELERREALLNATEARIEDKMTELKALQTLIEDLLIQHDEQEEAQLESLVKIYESMKPKQAAAIFEQLDMVVLLEVIGRMKERKSAPVLAKMNPARAKEITLELAQRREMPIARQ